MIYWLLTTEYPPFFGGGIGTYCRQTAEMMVSYGHSVTIFIQDEGVNDFNSKYQESIRIIRFNPSRTKVSDILGHTTNLAYEFSAIVKEFVKREGPPDIIEAQEYLGIAYYLIQYKFLLYDWCKNIPIIITAHSPSFLYLEFNHVDRYRYPNYWIGEMERFCLQAADHVIFPSEYLLNEITKRFPFNNSRISVIPNPYKARDFRIDSNFQPDQIIFYGKLSAQKGTFKLLAYFENLWQGGFTEKLYLIGGNDIIYHPEGKTMKALVEKKYRKYLREGKLIIEDRISPENLAERLKRVKLVIVPSMVDNLPYVVLEMMALGKLVLVSRQGGQAEIVHDNINGFVFDHELPATFFEKLHKLVDFSNSERKFFEANARATVMKRYSFSSIYEEKRKVFEAVTAKNTFIFSKFPYIRQHDSEDAEQPFFTENSLLSVVIPYYNMGNYIDETVTSLVNSSYKPSEIIIVNDGSTDPASLRKLNSYRDKADFLVLDISNKGLAHARNYGAMLAKGKYLAFLDADDIISPTYHAKAIDVLKAYKNVHFVGSWTKYFGGSDLTWPAFTPEPPIILYHNTVNSSSLVYKRESFVNAGLNDECMPFQGLEDYASVISLLSKGLKGVVLPEIHFYYRVRSDSMIRGVNAAKKKILCDDIAQKNSPFYANFAYEIFGLMNANGPSIHLDNPSLDYHLADNIPFGGRVSFKIISLIKKNKFIKTIAYKLFRFLNK